MANANENKPVNYARIEQLARDSGLFADTPLRISRVRYDKSDPPGRVEAVYVIPIQKSSPELLDDFQERLQAFIASECRFDDITMKPDLEAGGQWYRNIHIKFSWDSEGLTEQLPKSNEDKLVDYAYIEQLVRDSDLFADAPPQIRRFRYYESAQAGRVKVDYVMSVRKDSPELLDDFQEKLQAFIASKCRVDDITVESGRQENKQWVRDIHMKFSWHSDGLTLRSSRPVDYECVTKLVHESGLGDSLYADGDSPPITRTYYHIAGNRSVAFFQILISANSRTCLDELQKKLRAHITSGVGTQRLEGPSDRDSDGNWVRTIWLVFEWHNGSVAD